MVASRGPIPKRSDKRRRRNKPTSEIVKAPSGNDNGTGKMPCEFCSKMCSPGGGMASHVRAAHPDGEVTVPATDELDIDGRDPADAAWHPVAVRWYDSLTSSGQRVFYEPSDWALAFLLAESISRELQPQPVHDADGKLVDEVVRPPKGASLAAWLKGMSSLLVTEGDRRRMQIELQRTQPAGEEEGGSVSSIAAWRSRVDGTG